MSVYLLLIISREPVVIFLFEMNGELNFLAGERRPREAIEIFDVHFSLRLLLIEVEYLVLSYHQRS